MLPVHQVTAGCLHGQLRVEWLVIIMQCVFAVACKRCHYGGPGWFGVDELRFIGSDRESFRRSGAA